jgi:2-dehydropantoate 2-reductase
MKFGIIGAGAMGCLLGSFLARAKEEVWLVDVWEEHVKEIEKNGLLVENGKKGDRIRLRATVHPKEVGTCDVVIISTKFHHTRSAVQNGAPMIGAETVVMTIQNGIGNVEVISESVNPDQILFGLTTLGSVVLGPGRIRVTFSENAETHLGSLVGRPNEAMRRVVDAFNKAGLKFLLTPDVRERVWKKLCLNASLSMPLAIPKLRCGDFIDQPASQELVKALVSEIAAVAKKEGISLDPEAAYQYVVRLAKEAPNHLTSPLIDVLNHRKTEIDSLNGAVVEKAMRHGIEVPYNRAIYHLIRILENTYDQSIQHL